MLELKEIVKEPYQTANLVQVALNKVSVAFRTTTNSWPCSRSESGSGKTTMLQRHRRRGRFKAGDINKSTASRRRTTKARDWDAYRNNRIGFVFQA